MEPYARAYLHLLTSAVASGAPAEAFVFATRLTRLTRALGGRNPEAAIQRAAAAAPDWSSGTRIGEALRDFNDRYGRRGMARGAVVVILSDGWERADPALVGREMERLGAAGAPDRLGQPACRRRRLLARRGRYGGRPPALRRDGERPLARRHGRGRRGDRGRGFLQAAVRAGLARSPPRIPSRHGRAPSRPRRSGRCPMPSGYGPKRGRTTR